MLRLLITTFISPFLLLACSTSHPKMIIDTKLGAITIELYTGKAPITTNNFIRYVKENRLEGATFYRTVTMENQPENKIKIEVIQGGLFDDFHPQTLPPVEHETTEQTGILHKDGVISLARNEPGTATCEFFICIGDQPSLDYGGQRNQDGQGFAAFGKVISGMDVVHQIHKASADGQWLEPKISILTFKLVE
jgi:peptidyl-prolyl cis-trans isomerase A (cyclophilin A)